MNPDISKIQSLNELPAKFPYIRVGCDYYRIVKKPHRWGQTIAAIIPWRRQEIITDHGKEILNDIPKYIGFCLKPDNLSFEQQHDGYYNLYSRVQHKPEPGEWKWSYILLKHVFGEQYSLGLRYMQILFLHPEKSTVVLSLVSREQSTGKSTFINWLNQIFGANVAMLSSSDLTSQFNSYANKNILAIEETLLEKAVSIEKLKTIATQKIITVNEKFCQPYSIPFFGKLILASNHEDRFVKISAEEQRFFVRKLGTPTHTNHAIETDLLKEIPAFLHHLTTLPPVNWSVSRSGFTVEELRNDSLKQVIDESRSAVYKELEFQIQTHFNEHEEISEFLASPVDIKSKFFYHNSRVDSYYLARVMKTEMNMNPEHNQRYTPFETDTGLGSKTGTPYRFKREDYLSTCQIVTKPF